MSIENLAIISSFGIYIGQGVICYDLHENKIENKYIHINFICTII